MIRTTGFGPPVFFFFVLSCLRAFVLMAVGLGSAMGQPTAPDVAARTAVDRTAIFVGDRATYTIELTCRRGADILVDDLSRDKLKTDGLDVVDARMSRSERDDASGRSLVYRFDFIVTSYRVDAGTRTIAPTTVRYAIRRAGQRPEDAVPAGEVQVEGAAIAFRSALPDDREPPAIRADRPADERPLRFALLPAIGLGAIIVSIVPAIVAGAAAVRRIRRPRLLTARAARRAEYVSLEAVRAMDVETIDGRRAALTQLESIVRDHLASVCGVAAAGLTAPEAASALTNGHPPADVVAAVLTTCELARYAPADAMPSADACRDAIAQAETIIGARNPEPARRREP